MKSANYKEKYILIFIAMLTQINIIYACVEIDKYQISYTNSVGVTVVDTTSTNPLTIKPVNICVGETVKHSMIFNIFPTTVAPIKSTTPVDSFVLNFPGGTPSRKTFSGPIDSVALWGYYDSTVSVTYLTPGVFGASAFAYTSYDSIGYVNGQVQGSPDGLIDTSYMIMDSLIFVHSSSSSSISPTTCSGYISPSGKYIWTNSNTYLDTIDNSMGCDSVITINLTVNTVDTSVSQIGGSLISNADSATYRWLDCNNNFMAISGAVSKSFTAGTNGSYAVEVIKNGCKDTSSCKSITNVGIMEKDFVASLAIYPNPTTRMVTIDLGERRINVNILVRNIIGKLVSRTTYNRDKISLAIDGPSGIYFMEIYSDEGEFSVIKVLKE